MTKVAVTSRRDAAKTLDGRRWESKLLFQVRRELEQHCGGTPTPTQRALIDRASWLSLYVAQMDRRTASGHQMTEHDSRVYLAWSNSLGRTLSRIGLQGAPVAAPDLADYLATKGSPR